ncbi:carboxypeptidase regulatory-like domain-containing protein [Nocardioides psychrotolerans]|uniref:carboxypeptidase regulatory-like domain-containing protein n=1 Tax=Nocardioides psychrotolerans TaxID=1005945 RepID=UPI0031383A1A
MFLAVLALLMGGLAPAQAAGIVSGKVTDASAIGGPGLGGVTVTLTPQAPTTGATQTATTASDGSYAFTSAPNGSYAVKFQKAAYDPQDGPVITFADAAPDRTGTDAALENTTQSQIGGRVENIADTGLQDVTVTVQRRVASGSSAEPTYQDVATTTTKPNGTWAVFVPFGSYVVRFTASAFSTAYYKADTEFGAADPDDAGASDVEKGAPTGGLDVTMRANNVAFSGKVVTGAAKDPVSGVQVRVEYSVTQASGIVTQEVAASTTTAQNGTYSLAAPTAAGRSYTISYISTGFPTRFYTDPTAPAPAPTEGTPDRAGARTFPAEPGSTTLADLRLVPGSAVTGRVTDVGGAPLSGVAVTPVVFETTPTPWGPTAIAGAVTTRADGTYEVPVAQSNQPFRLRFTSPGRTTTFFPSASVAEEGTNISVAANQVLSGRDVVLPNLSLLSGTVTEPNGAVTTSVAGATVKPYRLVTFTTAGEQGGPSRTEWRQVLTPTGSPLAANVTSGAGYSLALPAGSYRLRFDGPGFGERGFLPGLVGLDDAPSVTVARQQSLTGQAFALSGKQLLQGTVSNGAGAPVPGTPVFPAYRFVADVEDGAPVTELVDPTSFSQPVTQADGSYSLTVRHRTYRVKAGSADAVRYSPRATSFEEADEVVVADNVVTGVDIELATGAPSNIHLPWISGLNQQGQTLTANNGTWSRDDLTFTYAWFGVDTDGNRTANPVSTARTYTIPAAPILPLPGGGSTASAFYDLIVTASATGETAVPATAKRTGRVGAGTPDIENRQIPIVTGKAAVGETLTGTDGQWSKAGTYTYQWFAGAQAITGATSKTFTITSAQLGKQLKLRVTETSGSTPSGGEVVDSKSTVQVVSGALRNTALPTITGETKVGKTLTATPGTWSTPSPTFAYQWLANGQVISGATAITFVPTAAEAGKSLVVRVIATSPGFSSGVASSAPTEAIGTDAIVNNALPTISGSPVVGGTLTTTNGTWTPVPTSFAYQWLADGTAISGATAASYVPVAGDVGKRLSVRVTAKRAGSSDGVATSTQTVAVKQSDFVNNTAPIVSGTAAVGSPLTASTGTWTPTPTSFGYQWLADGTPIAGATGTSYTPVAGNVGRRISVTVTARKDGLADGTATSLQTAAVTDEPAAEPVEVTSGPRIAGTPRPGNILVANAGSFTPSTARATFQWLRSGVPVPGETDGTYAVGGNDLGTRLSVRVTYTPTSGDPVVRTSSATALVKTAAVLTTRVVGEQRPLTLNVRVRADNANPVQGTVRVLSDGVQVASGKLRNGQVVLRLRGLKPGRQVVKVVYGGEARVIGQSVVRKVTVRR